MTDAAHEQLATVLNSVVGKVAFSNYDCVLMDDLYPAPKWNKLVLPEKTNHATKGKRSEVLWTNYDPHDADLNRQSSQAVLEFD
jgi:DNA adenine methylase